MFKSNKRRILSIFIMVLALIVLVPSFALSYFYFTTSFNINDTTIANGSVNSGIDDIKENYTGSKDDSSKEYTIYFFPSTLYAQIGYEYEVNPSNVKPEDVFGYVEYTYDEESGDGILSNPYNEHVSNSKYIMNDESGDVGYFDYVSNSAFITRNLYNSKDSYVHSLDDTSPDNIREYRASRYIFQTDIGSQKYYKYNPETVIPGDGNQDKAELEEAKKVYSEKWESYVYKHYRFRNDRLGFWPNIEYNLGRYLPIKIEVTDYLPPYVYDDMNLIPFTDMGDSSPINETWYNFAFAGWGYFDSNNKFTARSLTNLSNSTSEPNYMKDSFTAADIESQTFDIMNDLSIYADDENIIRLYPLFSNGKNYATQNHKGNTYEIAKEGGRDGLKIQFEYKNLSENIRVDEQYFLYQGVIGKENGFDTSNIPVAVASVNNININPADLESLEIRGAAIGLKGSGDWDGSWNIISDEGLINNGTFNSNYEVLDNFGPGLYNIYVFVLEPTLYGGYIEGDYTILGGRVDASNSFDKTFKEFFNGNDLYKYLKDSYRNFRGFSHKDLSFLFETPVSLSNKIMTGESFFGSYKTNDYSYSKALIAVEKITESKFIEAINLENSVSEQTSNKYNQSLSMLKVEGDSYKAEGLDSSVLRFGTDMSNNKVITDVSLEKIDYDKVVTDSNLLEKDDIVILKNIDFTNYSTIAESAFQIRLFEKYQEDLNFEETDDSNLNLDGSDINKPLDMIIYNPENNNIKDENVFIDASYYFDLIKANESIDIEGTPYTPDERIYVPRNSTYLGKYDFLLYHDRENNCYKLYAYRHSNAHIYVYTNNEFTTDENGFVNPSLEDGDLLWRRKTTIGSYAELADLGTPGAALDSSSNNEISFHDMINRYLNSLNDTSKTYYIRDHVTGIDLFRFTYNTETSSWDAEKLLNNFRIRKNYIFYITDKEPLVNQSSGN